MLETLQFAEVIGQQTKLIVAQIQLYQMSELTGKVIGQSLQQIH